VHKAQRSTPSGDLTGGTHRAGGEGEEQGLSMIVAGTEKKPRVARSDSIESDPLIQLSRAWVVVLTVANACGSPRQQRLYGAKTEALLFQVPLRQPACAYANEGRGACLPAPVAKGESHAEVPVREW